MVMTELLLENVEKQAGRIWPKRLTLIWRDWSIRNTQGTCCARIGTWRTDDRAARRWGRIWIDDKIIDTRPRQHQDRVEEMFRRKWVRESSPDIDV